MPAIFGLEIRISAFSKGNASSGSGWCIETTYSSQIAITIGSWERVSSNYAVLSLFRLLLTSTITFSFIWTLESSDEFD